MKSDEILKMAVGLLPEKTEADLDGDGKVTSSDGRIALRREKGLEEAPGSTASLMAEDVVKSIIKSSGDYSYDVNTDALYNQYKKQYEEMGSRAAEDVMGRASALTGGYGNSYASSIAADTRAKYDAMLDEKRAELEENAYKKQKDTLDRLYSLYNLLSDEQEKEEDRKKAALDFAVTASEYGDNSFIKALGIDPSDSDFKKLKEKAELYAKYGDYSELQKLGIDVSGLEREKQMGLSEFFAEYGDYSGLRAMGIDVSQLLEEKALDRAETMAKYGDYSALNKLGIDTSKLTAEEKRELEKYKLQNAMDIAKYGDYSALNKLGIDTSKLTAEEKRELEKYKLQNAMDIAKYGDYSALNKLGIDTSKLTAQEKREIAELYAKYGDYSLLNALGVSTADREAEEYYDRLLKRQKAGV